MSLINMWFYSCIVSFDDKNQPKSWENTKNISKSEKKLSNCLVVSEKNTTFAVNK